MVNTPDNKPNIAAAMAFVAGAKDRQPVQRPPVGFVVAGEAPARGRRFVRTADREGAAGPVRPKETIDDTMRAHEAAFGSSGDLQLDARAALDALVGQAQAEKASATPQPLRRRRQATPAFLATFADAFPGGGGSDSGGGRAGGLVNELGGQDKKVTKEEKGERGQIHVQHRVRRTG